MKQQPGFAAAVLAGGQSKRMGTDKAFLTHQQTQRPYWQHQQALLQSLQPSRVIISANADQDFKEADIVRDTHDRVGPLGGLLACLESMHESLLLVLAVDMIAMTTTPLQTLLDGCQDRQGAVYRDDGFFQPTAAVYPLAALDQVRAFQESGKRRLQDLLQQLVEADFMKVLPLPGNQRGAFANVNAPQDLTHA